MSDMGNGTNDDDLFASISEAADILPPLPPNWPRIPQLFVRRSWDFSTATHPAINKATNHLELLQNAVEDWFKENEEDILSRASSILMKSRATSAGSGLQPSLVMPEGLSGTILNVHVHCRCRCYFYWYSLYCNIPISIGSLLATWLVVGNFRHIVSMSAS